MWFYYKVTPTDPNALCVLSIQFIGSALVYVWVCVHVCACIREIFVVKIFSYGLLAYEN